MTARNNGGPAFPGRWMNESDMNATAPDGQIVPPGCEVALSGMSLRDWLAGHALAGILAADAGRRPSTPDGYARAAYAAADAMIGERSKPR